MNPSALKKSFAKSYVSDVLQKMVYVLTMHEVLLKSEQADVYTASIWVTPYLLPACYPDDFWHEYQALQHHLNEEEGSKIGRKKDEGKKER